MNSVCLLVQPPRTALGTVSIISMEVTFRSLPTLLPGLCSPDCALVLQDMRGTFAAMVNVTQTKWVLCYKTQGKTPDTDISFGYAFNTLGNDETLVHN